MSCRIRKTRKRALEASKAPVSMDSIRPERVGKVLDKWKDEMKTNGPPSARRRYPGIYPSKGRCAANPNRRAPAARKILPMILLIRGPKVSSIVPTGRAQTFVATAAIVNMRFRLVASQ